MATTTVKKPAKAPKCWQCKRTMVWVTSNGSKHWTPKYQCPRDCGPKALADLFRF